jgi:hypothetical protein
MFGGDEKKIQNIWDSEYSLKEFLDPNRFKSYEELKKRFEEVMGVAGGASASAPTPAPAKASAAKATTRTVLPQDDDDPPFDVTPSKGGKGGGASTSRQQEEEDAFAALVEKD